MFGVDPTVRLVDIVENLNGPYIDAHSLTRPTSSTTDPMSDLQSNHHVSHLRHRSHRSYTSLAPSTMHSPTSEYPFTARSTAAGSSFTPDQFRVLQDMQRVLYRGYEIGEGMAGKEEVREFIEDRFDSDCLYESPLLTLQNTDLLQNALNLCHTVSSTQLPSIRPTALYNHATKLAGYGLNKIWDRVGSPYLLRPVSSGTQSKGKEKEQSQPVDHDSHLPTQIPSTSSSISSSDLHSHLTIHPQRSESHYGVPAVTSAFGRYHSSSHPYAQAREHDREREKGKGDEDWWRAWEVQSVCGEVNEMETYDGFHFGFIEHTLILSLLPDWLDPIENDPHAHTSTTTAHPSPFLPYTHLPGSTHTQPYQPYSRSASHVHLGAYAGSRPVTPAISHSALMGTTTTTRYHETNPAPGLASTLKKTFLHNVLRYKLHLHTIVEFNEAGKIVYIRDLVDLRDLLEGLIPFGRETGWIGRRLGGIALAGIGRLVFGPTKSEEQEDESREKREREEEGRRRKMELDLILSRSVSGNASMLRMGEGRMINSLGLDVDMDASPNAPDVDSGGEGTGVN